MSSPTVPNYERSWENRAGLSYLRLTSFKRRNGVRLFVQQGLSPDAPEEAIAQAVSLLEKRLSALVNGRKNK